MKKGIVIVVVLIVLAVAVGYFLLTSPSMMSCRDVDYIESDGGRKFYTMDTFASECEDLGEGTISSEAWVCIEIPDSYQDGYMVWYVPPGTGAGQGWSGSASMDGWNGIPETVDYLLDQGNLRQVSADNLLHIWNCVDGDACGCKR